MSMLLQHLSKEFMREIGVRSREVYEMILPPIDIFEDGSNLVIMIDMPGFEKESIRTRLTENVLIVNAKREPVERDGVTYWEQRPLKIHKRIPLPAKVNIEEEVGTTAKYDNGVLTIKLPLKSYGKVTIQ